MLIRTSGHTARSRLTRWVKSSSIPKVGAAVPNNKATITTRSFSWQVIARGKYWYWS